MELVSDCSRTHSTHNTSLGHWPLQTCSVLFLPLIQSGSNVITWETVAHDLACSNCICNYEIKWRMDFILLPKLENLIFCVHLSLKCQFTSLFLFLLHTHEVAHTKCTKNLCMKYLGHIYQNGLRSNLSVSGNIFLPMSKFIISFVSYINLEAIHRLQQSALSFKEFMIPSNSSSVA